MLHSGNTRPQSTLLAEPLWTYPGLKSGISMCESISTKREKKSAGGKWQVDGWTLPKSSHARKKPPPHVAFEQIQTSLDRSTSSSQKQKFSVSQLSGSEFQWTNFHPWLRTAPTCYGCMRYITRQSEWIECQERNVLVLMMTKYGKVVHQLSGDDDDDDDNNNI